MKPYDSPGVSQVVLSVILLDITFYERTDVGTSSSKFWAFRRNAMERYGTV
jgi:hypothetical protein